MYDWLIPLTCLVWTFLKQEFIMCQTITLRSYSYSREGFICFFLLFFFSPPRSYRCLPKQGNPVPLTKPLGCFHKSRRRHLFTESVFRPIYFPLTPLLIPNDQYKSLFLSFFSRNREKEGK